MKIMVDILKAFFVKLSINDDIKDCVLDFADNGVNVLARNEKSIAVKAELKSFTFVDYKSIGKVGVRDIKRLNNYLDTLKGEITIKVKENKMILNDDNIFWDYGLCDEEFVKSNLKKFPAYDATAMHDLIGEKMGIMKNLIKSVKTDEMKIVSNATETVFHVNSEQDCGKMTVPFSFGDDMTVLVGESFIKVINVLGNKVQVCFKNNAPMLIIDKSEFMEFHYIVSNKTAQE